MYIFKNAFLNIVRSKGRNILLGIIVMIIVIGCFVSITINRSGNNLVESYKTSNPLKVTISVDTMSYRNGDDEDKEDFEFLTVDKIDEIGSLSTVNGYYYTLSSYLNSEYLEAVSYEDLFKKDDDSNTDSNMPNFNKGNNMMKMSSGDYNIVAYSDISYNEDFVNGDKKLIDGEMIDKDNTDNVIVISEELATLNDLSVGDKVTFTNANDDSISYEYEIVGIYEITNDNEMQMGRGMQTVSSNVIYTNLTVLNNIISDDGTDTDSYEMFSKLSSAFYVEYEDIDTFYEELDTVGLSEYYKVSTNEDEVTSTLNPIKNVTSVSVTFLIVILVVGLTILVIINLFNIRERKYEIGVLRAIGMTKGKVTTLLVSELMMVSLVALVFGCIFGSIISQPVSNLMLKNEISSYTEEQTNMANNFGSDSFTRPGFSGSSDKSSSTKDSSSSNDDSSKDSKVPSFSFSNNVDNYVDSLTVHTDFLTILEIFGITLALTLLSGVVAVVNINKFEPNKILQNRG